MKDDYDSLEEAFAVLEDTARTPDPDEPPGFHGVMLMTNSFGTTICARTAFSGQLISLSVIIPKSKTTNTRYFLNAQEVRRTLPQLEIDLPGKEGEPGGVLGEGLDNLGIKWAMLRNGLDDYCGDCG